MLVPPLELPLGPPAPLHSAVARARELLVETVSRLLPVPDAALARPWRWQDGGADVRYGFYRLYETLEEAKVALGRTLERGAARRTEAGRILAQATAARWDLHGLLLPLRAADLDREPGQGEWTLRRTLAHTLSSQWSYTFRTAYAVHRARAGREDLPVVAPETAMPVALRGMGSGGVLAEIQRRLDEAAEPGAEARRLLDEALDAGVGLLQMVDDEAELSAPTTWSGFQVSVRFRLHRWGSHLREHTIHAEKTLALLGREPSEVERLARLVLGAYGRLEGLAFGLPQGGLDAPADGRSPAGLLAGAAETVAAHARTIRAAAS